MESAEVFYDYEIHLKKKKSAYENKMAFVNKLFHEKHKFELVLQVDM